MAIIPLLRVTFFFLISFSSLAVLAICAHIDYITAGYAIISLSFIPFGIGAACITTLSLPVFLALGNLPYRVFTSTILFEIIWLFGLWVLWIGVAGDTVIGKANRFPAGCIYDEFPTANQICYEWTVLEAFAFFNFFCAFVYNDVILSYAIINSIRGRNVWMSSVKEAASNTPKNVDGGVPMTPPQSGATQHQGYGAYSSELCPTKPQNVQVHSKPCNAYPEQVLQGPPPQYSGARFQQALPQGPLPKQYSAYAPQAPPRGPHPQQHITYSPQALPQGPPPQHYGAYPEQQAFTQGPPTRRQSTYSQHTPQKLLPHAYPQQAPPQGSPVMQMQSYPSPGSPQKRGSYVGYPPSPTSNDFPLPPQPNYSTYPIVCSPPQSPPPGGYQPQPMPQARSRISYGAHLPIVV